MSAARDKAARGMAAGIHATVARTSGMAGAANAEDKTLGGKADSLGVVAGPDPAIHTPSTGLDFDEVLPIAPGRMAGSSPTMTRETGTTLHLFAEDFDPPSKPGTTPEPGIVEPALTQADLETARRQAWQDGHAAATAESAQAAAAAIRNVLAMIAAGMTEARADADKIAQQTAADLARLLFDGFAAVFPATCAAYGEKELRSLTRTVLPALRQEPSISIQVNPAYVAALRQEIEQAAPDLAIRTEIIASETIRLGDIRVAWRGGQATRDSAALWQQVAEILAPAGLLSFAATKEPEHVE